MRAAAGQGKSVITANHSSLDLMDSAAVLKFFHENKPTSVILTAAKVGGIYANMSDKKSFLADNLAIKNSVIQGAL